MVDKVKLYKLARGWVEARALSERKASWGFNNVAEAEQAFADELFGKGNNGLESRG